MPTGVDGPAPAVKSRAGAERNTLLLGFTSLFNDLGSEMALPLLPFFFVGTLGAPSGGVALLEGLAVAAVYFAMLPSSILSDRWGRRKELAVAGYATAAVARSVYVVAGHWLQAMGARLVDRAAKGLRGPPRDALIAESVAEPGRGRAFGFQRALDSTGAVAGAGGAALLVAAGLDLRTVFLVALVPSAVSVLLVLRVREPPARIEPAPQKTPPEMGRLVFAAGLFGLGNLSALLLLLRAAELGVAPETGAALFALFSLSGALLAYPAGALSDRLGRRRAVVLGSLVQAGAMAGFALAPPGLPGLVALFLLAGFAYEFFQVGSRAYAAGLAPRGRRATALAGYQTALGFGTVAGGVAVGGFWALYGAPAAFGFAAAASLLSALVMLKDTFKP